MKKLVMILSALSILALFTSCENKSEPAQAAAAPVETKKALPAPVDTTNPESAKTPFAAACSTINATNLFEYLGRDDVLYIDLRDYPDYQKKHLRNFECIPFFAFIYNKDAGKDPSKIQLYGGAFNEPVATYQESDEMLEVFFPKDKTIFFMCQSGGRVAQLLQILNAKGYDMSKIYNVGGMGQFTAPGFKDYTVDALEFKVNATYAIEGLTKN